MEKVVKKWKIFRLDLDIKSDVFIVLLEGKLDRENYFFICEIFTSFYFFYFFYYFTSSNGMHYFWFGWIY